MFHVQKSKSDLGERIGSGVALALLIAIWLTSVIEPLRAAITGSEDGSHE